MKIEDLRFDPYKIRYVCVGTVNDIVPVKKKIYIIIKTEAYRMKFNREFVVQRK